jgi:glutathione S-transferase
MTATRLFAARRWSRDLKTTFLTHRPKVDDLLLWVFRFHTSSVRPTTQAPVYNDIAAVPPSSIGSKPILFRDKEGLSPTAQQVWLAFEIKEADYVTVLTTTTTTSNIEEDNDDNKAATRLLKVQWPDGTIQTDSFAILERINEEYPVNGYNTQDLFQGVSNAVDNVRCNMRRLDPIFPRNTDQQYNLQGALYMYRKGELTSLDSHLVALESIDEVLEEYEDGPFLCGDFVSAADCYWAPYLERYVSQLPLTQPDDIVNPRYSGEYNAITEWFNAMEEQIPCYACRVGGDAISWENVLRKAVANGNVPQIELPAPLSSLSPKNNRRRDYGDAAAQKQWDKYRQMRPYLCKTPQEECVAYIVRNREEIIDKVLLANSRDTAGKSNKKGLLLSSSSMSRSDIDDALRETAFALLSGNSMEAAASKLSGNARDVAALLNEQLFAPRDMGMLSIGTLRNLVAAAPKPRIKAN